MTIPNLHPDLEERYTLQGSLLTFTRVFYKLRTGRDFELSKPIGRESHFETICRELVKVFRGETTKLIINVPPRYGKSELLIHFVAWAMSRCPDSNFLYVSYSHSLAKKQTQTIREIMQLAHYRKIMGVELRDDTQAKDNFETTKGGSVYAVGSGGTITGRGAGIQNIDRFGGAIVIDDILKPDEATSDVIRENVNNWYYNTLQSRLNSPTTPIICISQRLHEDELVARLIKTGEWTTCILPALDMAGNALHPAMHTVPMLKKMQEQSPYEFAAQYQQDPQPAGGGIFKPEWFVTYDYEPNILATFITADTAETDKTYNDATVFSFWGIYRIAQFGAQTDIYGLHWIDCRELRVEPKDLQAEFEDFYRVCMQHKCKPKLVAIEKKSTGVTLLSVLKEMQGLRVMDIDRNVKSGSKSQRFLNIQSIVAERRISLPMYGAHTKMCIEHCRKITANNTHAHDDICDTLADSIKIALIDKIIQAQVQPAEKDAKVGRNMSMKLTQLKRLRESAYR